MRQYGLHGGISKLEVTIGERTLISASESAVSEIRVQILPEKEIKYQVFRLRVPTFKC